jgi:hypothetical protein
VLLQEGHLWGRKQVAIPIRAVSAVEPEGIRLSYDTEDEAVVLHDATDFGLSGSVFSADIERATTSRGGSAPARCLSRQARRSER